jgi:hypothetical protein
MNIKRLTGPVGTNCTPGQATSLDEGTKRIMAAIDTAGPPTLYPLDGMAKALEPTVGPIAGITGVWYNPAQSGQGLFFENLGNGSVLAWWFTFGPTGGQAWFGAPAPSPVRTPPRSTSPRRRVESGSRTSIPPTSRAPPSARSR